jgi:tRNA threonylcarbamoyladenosine biosynthesis protein TsaE
MRERHQQLSTFHHRELPSHFMPSTHNHTYTAATLEEMQAAANALLTHFPDGGHFAVYGEMGAGKTTFIHGVCKALNLPFAGSPTFSLVNEYTLADGRKLYHFDLYRLNNAEELTAIGFEEYLETGTYVFIEWPQIASAYTEGMNILSIRDENGVREIEF